MIYSPLWALWLSGSPKASMASGMLSKLTSPFAVAIFWCLCLECASNALQDREQSNEIEREDGFLRIFG